MGTDSLAKQKRNIEIIIAILIPIFILAEMGYGIYREWPSWFAMYCGFSALSIWIISFGKFQSANVRIVIIAILQNISVVMYSIFAKDMLLILVPFGAMVVVLALFAYPPTIWLSIVNLMLMTLIHVAWVNSIDFMDSQNVMKHLFAIVSTLVICIVLHMWVHFRNNNQKNMAEFVQEMEKAQNGKDDFLANVSHEIRTPINTISGLVDIILEEDDPQKTKDEIVHISQAARNLMFVVSDIVDFSELEQGQIFLEEETYDISSTINDVVVMASSLQNNQKVELIVNYAADLPRGLVGDEKRLRRAIMNIVNNAFKFTEEGCVVIDIFFRKESYGINLIISIRDTGIGMKEVELENLFSTYNQADAGRTRAVGGIGLGLNITRAIIRKMGGTISAFSEYEKGTEIRITVPQRVVDERPIITIKHPDQKNVAIYFNLEHYEGETRDEYYASILNMKEQLKVKTVFCRNLAELKRRQSEGNLTHIFISISEYREDCEYFDNLSAKMNVVVVMDTKMGMGLENKKIHQIFKPFQLMPIAYALNIDVREQENNAKNTSLNKKFICPDVRVLVVDDNELNIHVIAGILKRYQITVEMANSGAMALEKITSQDYDFVFMDHMMPEMDGVECLHRIRSMPGHFYQSVPIVALTANAVAGAREMLIGEGFNDFLEKPVEISVLERMLRRVLPPQKFVEESEPEDTTESKTETQEQNIISDGNYTYESLNCESGYVYCGGEESYRDILSIYANKGEKNYEPLQAFFDEEDWNNYIITIHGVKSSMKSIGADELSELARRLEMAGKDGDFDYIRANHAKAYDMLKSLILDLMKRFQVAQEEEHDISNLPELSKETFEEIKRNLENAAFELDGDKMLDALKIARGTRYGKTEMDKVIAEMEKKISMLDFIPAMELVMKLK